MSDQLFQTDLFTADQGNGCAACCGHDHATADCPHGQAMTLELADATGTLTAEAPADGHHADCDGWRSECGPAEIRRHGPDGSMFRAECACGWVGQLWGRGAMRAAMRECDGHAGRQVECDGRCLGWGPE